MKFSITAIFPPAGAGDQGPFMPHVKNLCRSFFAKIVSKKKSFIVDV